ncbi:MAG: hypothetical protein IJ228_10595 [Succinivibrio sp.]|nr:hypothetical protein [Succinivibrio sp.]
MSDGHLRVGVGAPVLPQAEQQPDLNEVKPQGAQPLTPEQLCQAQARQLAEQGVIPPERQQEFSSLLQERLSQAGDAPFTAVPAKLLRAAVKDFILDLMRSFPEHPELLLKDEFLKHCGVQEVEPAKLSELLLRQMGGLDKLLTMVERRLEALLSGSGEALPDELLSKVISSAAAEFEITLELFGALSAHNQERLLALSDQGNLPLEEALVMLMQAKFANLNDLERFATLLLDEPAKKDTLLLNMKFEQDKTALLQEVLMAPPYEFSADFAAMLSHNADLDALSTQTFVAGRFTGVNLPDKKILLTMMQDTVKKYCAGHEELLRQLSALSTRPPAGSEGLFDYVKTHPEIISQCILGAELLFAAQTKLPLTVLADRLCQTFASIPPEQAQEQLQTMFGLLTLVKGEGAPQALEVLAQAMRQLQGECRALQGADNSPAVEFNGVAHNPQQALERLRSLDKVLEQCCQALSSQVGAAREPVPELSLEQVSAPVRHYAISQGLSSLAPLPVGQEHLSGPAADAEFERIFSELNRDGSYDSIKGLVNPANYSLSNPHFLSKVMAKLQEEGKQLDEKNLTAARQELCRQSLDELKESVMLIMSSQVYLQQQLRERKQQGLVQVLQNSQRAVIPAMCRSGLGNINGLVSAYQLSQSGEFAQSALTFAYAHTTAQVAEGLPKLIKALLLEQKVQGSRETPQSLQALLPVAVTFSLQGLSAEQRQALGVNLLAHAGAINGLLHHIRQNGGNPASAAAAMGLCVMEEFIRQSSGESALQNLRRSYASGSVNVSELPPLGTALRTLAVLCADSRVLNELDCALNAASAGLNTEDYRLLQSFWQESSATLSSAAEKEAWAGIIARQAREVVSLLREGADGGRIYQILCGVAPSHPPEAAKLPAAILTYATSQLQQYGVLGQRQGQAAVRYLNTLLGSGLTLQTTLAALNPAHATSLGAADFKEKSLVSLPTGPSGSAEVPLLIWAQGQSPSSGSRVWSLNIFPATGGELNVNLASLGSTGSSPGSAPAAGTGAEVTGAVTAALERICPTKAQREAVARALCPELLKAYAQASLIFKGQESSHPGSFSIKVSAQDDQSVRIRVDSLPDDPVEFHRSVQIDTEGRLAELEFLLRYGSLVDPALLMHAV